LQLKKTIIINLQKAEIMKSKKKEYLENFNSYLKIEQLKNLNDLYLEKEKNYLQVIFIQFLRNINSEKFDECCLMNLFCFSEYLNSKIFQVLSKKNKKDLKLDEFISGINLLFSKLLPANGKILTEIIFDLISNTTESIIYQSIKEFANNILFECFCKAQIYDFEYFLIFSKNLRRLIKKTFSIGLNYTKLYKFCKDEFLIISNKNSLFIKILIILLNLLSPINENLIFKLINTNDIQIFNNDDFEKEIEIEFDESPRINPLPKEISVNSNNFEINLERKKYYSIFASECFNNDISFGNIKINDNKCNMEDVHQTFDVSFKSIDQDLNNNRFNINSKNLTFFHNYDNENKVEMNKISNIISNQDEVSTDISRMIGSGKNINRNSIIFSSDKENQNTNLRSEFSNVLKIDYKYSDYTMKEEIIKTPRLNEQKSNINKGENLSETEYLFISEKNEILKYKDLRLLKFEENDREIIDNIFFLYNKFKKPTQIKSKKLKILFRKTTSFNINHQIFKNNNYIDLYNTQNEDKTLPFMVKFVENDMIIYNLQLNNQANEFKNNAHFKDNVFEEFLLQKLNFIEKGILYILLQFEKYNIIYSA